MLKDVRERVPVVHPNEGASRTKQADLKASDINHIVAKWVRTGVPPQTQGALRYGDFSNVDDYLTCCMRVREAEEQFMRLPSRVRKYCDNNPGKFLDLVFDPERRGVLEALGLVEPQRPHDESGVPLEPPAEEPPEES